MSEDLYIVWIRRKRLAGAKWHPVTAAGPYAACDRWLTANSLAYPAMDWERKIQAKGKDPNAG